MSEIKQKISRQTNQRQLILDYLLRCGQHPTAENIFLVIKQTLPKISLATVYRNLVKLEQDNLITAHSFLKQQTRYEFGVHPHYHFYCQKCHALHHLEIDSLLNLNYEVAARHGVTVNFHQMYFFGLCVSCKKAN